MKKLFGLLAVSIGILFANVCFGAESLFSWQATNTTALVGWIGQIWTDFSLPIVAVLGISLGFIVIRKLIGLVKIGAR